MYNMNILQDIINRQVGIYSHINNTYDIALNYLCCTEEDNFFSFYSSNNEIVDGGPVFACKFAETKGYENILALANEDGKIAVYNTKNDSKTNGQIIVQGHYNAIFDIAWLHDSMKLISVSGDHTARLFDVTESGITEERIFHGHVRSVKTIATRKNDTSVFATGSRDGAIFVWDIRANVNSFYVKIPDRIISSPHKVSDSTPSSRFRKRYGQAPVSQLTTSVTSLVFQDDNTLISSAASGGVLNVWDIRYYSNRKNPKPKYSIPYAGNSFRNGYSNLLVDENGLKLYASCMDNNIYCYNISSYNPIPIMTYYGHQNYTFYVKSSLSCDGKYLLTGSSDNNAYIYNTKYSKPIIKLEGHIAEVTCTSWCKSSDLKVVTCSDDMHHKIWRLHLQDRENLTIDKKNSIKGYASQMSYKDMAQIFEARISNEYTTPTGGRKRRGDENITPHSQKKRALTCERCQMLTPGSEQSLKINCDSCLFISRSKNKRTASESKLCDPNVVETKRVRENGARRLFGTLQDTTNSPSNTDNGVLATILEEKIEHETFSPTANLPNFVIDGEAPHLKNYSPRKKRENDWLTKIRIEQSLRNRMEELSQSTSPKQPRFTSPRLTNPAVRKSLHSSIKKNCNNSNSPTSQSPLLKYFRSTNSSGRSPARCGTPQNRLIDPRNDIDTVEVTVSTVNE